MSNLWHRARYGYKSLFQAVNRNSQVVFAAGLEVRVVFQKGNATLESAPQMLVLAAWFTSVQFNGKQDGGVGLQHSPACAAPATVSSWC